jgi:alkanesulfonate monooxygenase SsuD/methylene tetrahydromethanopterin reductase-like flavin-dependent oxidoreductase (luciferase family)
VHPVREEIPIYLASIGPKNLELTGEIADGWLAIFFSPKHAGEQLELIKAGRQKVGKTLDGFDVVPTMPMVVDDEWELAAESVRPYAALYIGGMGSREQNFYNNLACRMGYEEQAARIQDLYLAKDYAAAAAEVPVGFIDSTSLLGSRERIADRMVALAESGVTTLTVSVALQDLERGMAALRVAAEALDKAGVGD